MENHVALPNHYTYDGDRPYIFISYSHNDAKTVAPIIEELYDRGYRVWFDNGIHPGHDWSSVIGNHLEKCAAVLFFVSNSSANSDNCKGEIFFAFDNKKPIISVYLERNVAVPSDLAIKINIKQNIMKEKWKKVSPLVDKICEADFIVKCNMTVDERKLQEEWLKKEKERLQKEKLRKTLRAIKEKLKFIIIAAALIFAVLFVTVIYPSMKYNKALELMENGEYAEAFKRFSTLGEYEDSSIMVRRLLDEHKLLVHVNADVGETVIFGKYEQDNNWENGYDDIEWIVLENTGSKLLLVSKYALDCKPYHKTKQMVDWNGSFLRSWLNDSFYNSAFSEEEKKAVVLTDYVTVDNTEYGQPGGYDTQDHVFMLNIEQVRSYKLFADSFARMCEATPYAKSLGAYVNGSGHSWWWLCTPGEYLSKAAGVNADGEISSAGDTVTIGDNVVRPAIWLNLES